MFNLSRTQILILVILILAICALAAVILFMFGATLLQPGPSQTGTPAAPSADDSWGRVKGAGKLVVGLSADYPPFEYYTSDFKMDGFDVALVQKIGQQLGLPVEFQDITFDGLAGALQLKQVDLAISAISITPERVAALDFSNAYAVSQDAVLASQDSKIQLIKSPSELASFRLGVQNSSVYESWVRLNLVLPGKMPAANLFVYALTDQALADLKANKIDLVLMDLLPAQVFAQQGGYRIVGQGINTQQYGIAVSKGSASLLAELNRALGQLQSQGQIAQLAQQYLHQDPNVPTPLPPLLPTPLPTLPPPPPSQPTPTSPAPACVDGMSFVQDLTYPDYQMKNPPVIQPGAPFRKGWRIRNVGSCTWNPAYRLVYANGNNSQSSMSGAPTPLIGQVPPGGTYDIYVNLVGPYWPGVYQGFWILQNGSNTPFGQRIWVGIQVPGPLPGPTQTPSPSISFSSDRTNINAGDRVVFTWNVQNAKQVYFSAQGDLLAQKQPQSISGRAEVYPNDTTIYELHVLKLDNQSEVRQILITVQQSPNPPVITQFTAQPAQVDVGNCVNISWNVDGNTTNITLLSNGNVLWDAAPMSGSTQDCPASAGVITYRIQATGPGGSANQQSTVEVQERPGPLPVPQITYFTVSPDSIAQGDYVNISWNVEGGAVHIQILRDGQVIEDQAPMSGGIQDNPSSPGMVTYSIQASGPGGSASDQASVNVLVPQDTPVPPPTEEPFNPVDQPTEEPFNPVDQPTDEPFNPVDQPTPEDSSAVLPWLSWAASYNSSLSSSFPICLNTKFNTVTSSLNPASELKSG
jgi:polar amino acid transport system substrate-binding protein